jgi:DNA-binding NarL/FixJ family response regulator
VNSILIIEDDDNFRSSISLILKMEGFEVRTAKNGALGIAAALENRPDLILCDIMMPEMDGYSVLEYLKKDSNFDDIPFIFVTALGDRNNIRRGMNVGADDYLTKPFSAEELVAAVVGRLHRIETIRSHAAKTVLTEEQITLLQQITPREREILIQVGKGATSKEIAERVNIRLNTVEVHRANLMKKLQADNAVKLARWAFIAEQYKVRE